MAKQKQHLINMMKSDEDLGLYERPKQERLCDSEVIQRIRASKSDAESRRIIRTI